MALNIDFYNDIYVKEKVWITNLEYNLLNVYYLPELKIFYEEKNNILKEEYNKTQNEILKGFIIAISNIIGRIDYFIKIEKEGNLVNLYELNDLFIINRLNNDISYTKQNKIENHKKSLYELRKKVINESSEEYIDDDFYYEDKKIA